MLKNVTSRTCYAQGFQSEASWYLSLIFQCCSKKKKKSKGIDGWQVDGWGDGWMDGQVDGWVGG